MNQPVGYRSPMPVYSSSSMVVAKNKRPPMKLSTNFLDVLTMILVIWLEAWKINRKGRVIGIVVEL